MIVHPETGHFSIGHVRLNSKGDTQSDTSEFPKPPHTGDRFSVLVGGGFFVNPLPPKHFPLEKAVQDGAKVTCGFKSHPGIAHPTYSNIEQFVQGQHTIPLEIEQRIAGMHPGEVTSFPLLAEEGFGLYDETKIQTIPPADLPLEAREGDA